MSIVDALLSQITADADGVDWQGDPQPAELARVIALARELESRCAALELRRSFATSIGGMTSKASHSTAP